MSDHAPDCPRSQAWDVPEAPCTCPVADAMSDDVCPKCLRPRLLPGMTGAGCARELLRGDAGDCHRATVARAERAEAERDVLRAQRDTARADADDAMRQVVALQARTVAIRALDELKAALEGKP